ncbi:Crossover junction endonuclease eme1 [Fusarium oxysporum f. sp. raphani]|uniref:Crossover junction endonuclease eme1 n=1 Tax=Fusarium oxysporum f. sp. raphani TaxID=96318 RepID=A0A8J5UDJ4_FUSOX|nr:Crossover junction endonuclease eme1 [Fusarium oxysporum f. sp. raphani]
MAPDVIDLISSSPPPSQSIPPSAQVPETNRIVEPEKRHLPSIDATHSASPGLFLSDDFDTTIDLDEPILVNANPNKRRCLYPQRNHLRSSAFLQLQNLKQFSRQCERMGMGELLQLEPSTYTGKPSTDTISKPTKQPLDAEDSDPFASSPQPVRRAPPKPKPLARPIESSDPFASSPHQAPVTTKVPEAIITSPPAPPPKPAPKPAPKKNATWDPISSSAPDVFSFDSSPPRKNNNVINIDDSDGGDGSEDELPDIASFDVAKMRRRSQLQRSQSDVVSSRSRTKPAASNTKSAAERAREKEAKAAAKEVEKETKRREKQEAKEAKLREKERTAALAEVNKLRTDKKVSTPEMMVDIPSSLNATVTTELQTMLEPFDVQYTIWNSPVDNVIKWRRKVRSRYNDEIGLWEPIPLRLEDEKHALVVMHADEFVKLAQDDQISTHVGKMQRHFADHSLVYLIEGLTPWMRKNRNLRNRQFTSNVRAQEAAASTAGRRRNNPLPEYVSEELIEDALLQLQVMHEVLIHHTMIPMETAEQILTFTQHISTIPYRKQRDIATLGAGFCMESGQVKTGEDAKDTYVRMLQEIVRVTAPIAYGVAAEFGTVSSLVRGLEERGPTLLEGVKKSANKDGAFTDRMVGQAVSRRMYKVFTGVDETSTDV